MAIGSLGKDARTGKHWRKRWAKGTPCCYVAIQTPQGALLQTETPLSVEEMHEILEAVGLRNRADGKARKR